MSSAEDFLRQDGGALLMSLLFQLAMVKAENARLQAQLAERVPPDLIPRGA